MARVVLGKWRDPNGVIARSRREPDAVFVCFRTRTLTRDGVAFRLAPQNHQFAAALLTRVGSLISRTEMLDHLYFDKVDGGPDATLQRLNTLLHQTRPALARLGFSVERDVAFGFRTVPITTRLAA